MSNGSPTPLATVAAATTDGTVLVVVGSTSAVEIAPEKADLDDDGTVTLADIELMESLLGPEIGEAGYFSALDFSSNSFIDFEDLDALVPHFGLTGCRRPRPRPSPGFVFDDIGSPLPGVTVSVDSQGVSAVTGEDGRYELTIPAGATGVQALMFDGSTAVDPTPIGSGEYPTIPHKPVFIHGGVAGGFRSISLPERDLNGAVRLDATNSTFNAGDGSWTTNADLEVRNVGVTLEIPAGTTILFPPGENPVVSITRIRQSNVPVPISRELAADAYVTYQPGGTQVTRADGQGLTTSFLNSARFNVGEEPVLLGVEEGAFTPLISCRVDDADGDGAPGDSDDRIVCDGAVAEFAWYSVTECPPGLACLPPMPRSLCPRTTIFGQVLFFDDAGVARGAEGATVTIQGFAETPATDPQAPGIFRYRDIPATSHTSFCVDPFVYELDAVFKGADGVNRSSRITTTATAAPGGVTNVGSIIVLPGTTVTVSSAIDLLTSLTGEPERLSGGEFRLIAPGQETEFPTPPFDIKAGPYTLLASFTGPVTAPGKIDEDPVDSIDNDGDGFVDEDPDDGIDNDNDSVVVSEFSGFTTGVLDRANTSRVEIFRFVGRAEVAVNVVDDQGDPVAGAEVQLDGVGGTFATRFVVPPSSQAAITDAAGMALLQDVPLGSCRVVVRDPDDRTVVGVVSTSDGCELDEMGERLTLNVVAVPANIPADGLLITPAPNGIPSRSTESMLVVLGTPSPVSGVRVTLASDDPTVASVPGFVDVLAGQTSALFDVTTGTDLTSTVIRGVASGLTDGSATVNVLGRTMTLTVADVVGAAGTTTPATLTLADPAPPGGVTVTFSSSDPTLATLEFGGETFATIDEGKTFVTGNITVTGLKRGVPVLSASAPGYVTASVPIEVRTLLELPLGPTVLPLGSPRTLSLNLVPDAALAGGVVVTLTSSAPVGFVADLNPDTPVTDTTEVHFDEGELAKTFFVKGVNPTEAPVTITATADNHITDTTDVTVEATLSFDPGVLTFRDGSPPDPLEIRLRSGGNETSAASDIPLTLGAPSCVTVTPASPVIPAGQSSVDVNIDHDGVTQLPCLVDLTADGPGISGVATIRITVEAKPTITFVTESVGSGLRTKMEINTVDAFSGGVWVRIESQDETKALVSRAPDLVGAKFVDFELTGDQSLFTFYAHAIEGQAGQSVTLTATEIPPPIPPPGGFETKLQTGSTTINIVQPAVAIVTFGNALALDTSTSTLSPDDVFVVSLGVPDIPSTFNNVLTQPVRPGGQTVDVTITNTSLTAGVDVGTLVQNGGPVGSAVVQVVPGTSESPGTLIDGGVAFRPENAGSTLIAATAPGFVAVNDATVNVTAPNLSFSGLADVGEGLQDGVSIGISDVPATDLTVTIRAPSGGPVTLSNDEATPGGDTTTVTIAAGAFFSPTFYVQGISQGGIELVATAQGATESRANVNVLPVELSISGLATSTSTLSGPDPFFVSTGGPFRLQKVRAGAPLQVELVSEPVGSETVASVTGSPVTIPAVQFTGSGASLVPEREGQTVVTARVGGEVVSDAVTVTVSQPNMRFNNTSLPSRLAIGAGLESGVEAKDLPRVELLDAPAPHDITVRITSLAPAFVHVSNDRVTPGSATEVVIPAGSSLSDPVFLHGLVAQEGLQLEAVDVTPSPPGPVYASATVPIKVLESRLSILNLASQTTTLSPDDPFDVVVGIVDGAFREQHVGGTTDLQVDVTVVNPLAGQLQAGPIQNQTVQVPIAAGTGRTAPGAILFVSGVEQPETKVIAMAPGFADGTHDITVTTPDITVSEVGQFPTLFVVGSGLQAGRQGQVVLEGSEHGGVTLTVRSSDDGTSLPSLLVAPEGVPATDCDSGAPVGPEGSGCFEVDLANGETTINFTVHGVEGFDTEQSPSVIATAGGHDQGSAPARVRPVSLGISGLLGTQTAGASDDPFIVTLGVVDTGCSPVCAQPVRAGSPGVTLNVSNSSTATGSLITTLPLNPDGSVDVVLGPGAQATPSFGAGSLAFRPEAAGSTVIGASGPAGFLSVNVNVTVQP